MESETHIGNNGFVIPVERGQTLVIQHGTDPEQTRRLGVVCITGDRVILSEESRGEFSTNLTRLARHLRVGRYKVVEVIPPSEQERYVPVNIRH